MRLIGRFISTTILAAGIGAAVTWYLRKIWFYRDPERTPDLRERAIISPGDGQIMYIKPISGGNVISKKLGLEIPLTELTKTPFPIEEGWLIGIYMSPFDVHYNYSPVDGKLEKMVHTQTTANLPMLDLWEYINVAVLRRTMDLFGRRYQLENERNALFIKGDDVDTVVIQIADKFVNKIAPFVREGERLTTAQKVGFIERGSQVDLVILSKDIEFKVDIGQQVYGAQTVIATY